MKTPLLIILLSLITVTSFSQTSHEVLNGKVSFMSSQNIYVKFDNTDGIRAGDTLFITQDMKLIPALIVNSISSISCVGTPLNKDKFALSDPIVARKRETKISREKTGFDSKNAISPNDEAIHAAFIKQKENNSKEITGDHSGKLAVQVSPNPSGYFFNLSVKSSSKGNIEIRVLDMTGRMVKQMNAMKANMARFGEDLFPGTYFVEVRQGEEKQVIKVIKL